MIKNMNYYEKRKNNFLKKLRLRNRQRHEHIILVGSYKGMTTSTRFKCINPSCEISFKRRPFTVLSDKNMCPIIQKRAYKKNGLKRRYTQSQVASRVYKDTDGEYRLIKYNGYSRKSMFEHHSKHCRYYAEYNEYYRFPMTPDHFFHGERCPKDKFNSESKGMKQFRREVFNLTHGEYLVISHDYFNENHVVSMEHHSKKCNYYKNNHKYCTFLTTRYKFLHGSRCPCETFDRRSKAHSLTLKEARRRVREFPDGNEYRLIRYRPNHRRSLFEHHSKKCKCYKKYGKYCQFEMDFESFMSGCRCPFSRITRGELATWDWLIKHSLVHDIDFYYGYVFKCPHPKTPHPQHSDFYLPSICWNNKLYNGIDIEFDGAQHFPPSEIFGHLPSPKQRRRYNHIHRYDNIKKELCHKNHIKQIHIKNIYNYSHYSQIYKLVSKVLDKELLPLLFGRGPSQLALPLNG